MRTKVIKSATQLIAGNFANFHRHGWTEVKAVLDCRDYFKDQKNIRVALMSAYKNKSISQLNQLMIDFNISSVYPLPTQSKL